MIVDLLGQLGYFRIRIAAGWSAVRRSLRFGHLGTDSRARWLTCRGGGFDGTRDRHRTDHVGPRAAAKLLGLGGRCCGGGARIGLHFASVSWKMCILLLHCLGIHIFTAHIFI